MSRPTMLDLLPELPRREWAAARGLDAVMARAAREACIAGLGDAA
ncbi:MAG: hypothetical protein ACJ79S_06785 [Gemmatimonadaceae bacterium]